MWENDFANDDLAQGWTKVTTGCDLWEATKELRWLARDPEWKWYEKDKPGEAHKISTEFKLTLQQRWVNAGNDKEEWRDVPIIQE